MEAEKKETEEGRLFSRQRKSLPESDLLQMAERPQSKISAEMNAVWD
jgi:hypothetical protein